MLQVDLKKDDRELVQIITAHCAGVGVVKAVKIHRDPSPFALVDMADHYQTLELAGAYGGSAFGTSALIHLEQQS
jgi:hypothetical protein